MGIQNADKCAIQFFLDGKRHAYKAWPYVPRKGDEVMLGDAGADEKISFIVKRVVWGVEGPEGHDLGMQAVNIEIERQP